MKFSMVILAIVCLVGGLLLLPIFYTDFLEIAKDTVLTGKDYASVVFGAIK